MERTNVCRVDNYISQALLDYSLDMHDDYMKKILRRSLASYAMESQYYRIKCQFQRCNGKI
jgi:hypothetical protein